MRVGQVTVGGMAVGSIDITITNTMPASYPPDTDSGRAGRGISLASLHGDGLDQSDHHGVAPPMGDGTHTGRSAHPRHPPARHHGPPHPPAHHDAPSHQHAAPHHEHAPEHQDHGDTHNLPAPRRGSSDVDGAIRDAAKEAGVDPNTMRGIASIESNMNPGSNRNKRTQYKGLFQIGHEEWKKYGSGDIYNAHDNAMAAARMFKHHKSAFRAKYGRDPSDRELYMIHQQGLGFYTRGAMTNIRGNRYPGMHGPQSHQSFESGWGRELERRKSKFAGEHPTDAPTAQKAAPMAEEAPQPIGPARSMENQDLTSISAKPHHRDHVPLPRAPPDAAPEAPFDDRVRRAHNLAAFGVPQRKAANAKHDAGKEAVRRAIEEGDNDQHSEVNAHKFTHHMGNDFLMPLEDDLKDTEQDMEDDLEEKGRKEAKDQIGYGHGDTSYPMPDKI